MLSHPESAFARLLVLAAALLLVAAPVRGAEPVAPAKSTTPGRGAGANVFDPAKLHQVQVLIPRTEWDVLVRETYVSRGGGGVDSLEDDVRRSEEHTSELQSH